MPVNLKRLSEQVIVITGASSGIGLATAEAAAQQGAKLVLAARSEHSLNEIVARLTADSTSGAKTGAQAVAVNCDVADRRQIDQVVQVALDRFGRIDTWVNNAGLGMHGRLDEIDDADARRLFDINFWGVVNGSLAAMPHLVRSGGALINLGSEVSEAAVPLLGMYTASKHAVKGFTDSLRIEIEDVDQSPVSITLIQPQAVDTPFPEHSRNYMDREPKLPSPMIEARQVADAILEAAVKPTRSKKVGAMAIVDTAMAKFLPSVGDAMAAKQAGKQQYDEPPRNPAGALHRPSESFQTAGRTHGAGGKVRS